MSAFITFIQHSAMRQEKEINRMQMRKEEIRLPRIYRRCVFLGNPKESTKKLLELINEFSKVTGYTIHTKINPISTH